MFHTRVKFITSLFLLSLVLLMVTQAATGAQETSHTFPETGKTLSGIFLQYWHTHGALAQQGYPISDEMTLKSTDGKEYKTQFFERAVFEHHPEYAGTENEVLLKLVGQTFYDRHFGNTPPPNQSVNPTNTYTFQETGHAIGGKFRAYWEAHGGLAQQGYPMTDEFTMVSTDGKEYTTQVFQRAVFELHPEYAGTENEVLLRLLGVEEWDDLNKPKATPTPAPTATLTPNPEPQVNEGLPRVEITFGNGQSVTYEDTESPQFDFALVNSSRAAEMYGRVAEWMRAHGKQVPNKLIRKVLPPGDDLARARMENPEHSYQGVMVNSFSVKVSDTEETEVMMTYYGSNGIGYMQISEADYPKFVRAATANEKFGSEGQDYVSSQFIATDLIDLSDYSNIREMLGNDLADDLGKREGNGFIFNPPIQILPKQR